MPGAVPARTACCARSTRTSCARGSTPPDEFDAAAVCLLWGFRHPEHEVAAREALGDDVHVSLSHETAGVFREYERCATTVVDAALSPLLRALPRAARRAARPRPACRCRRSCCRAAASPPRPSRRGTGRGPCSRARRAAPSARRAPPRRPARRTPSASTWAARRRDVSVVLARARARESGGREVAGRALALPDGGRAHGRRGRRQHRVARRGRRAARGPAVGGRRARARVLRARRRRSRRSRTRTCCSAISTRRAARGRRRARPRRGRARRGAARRASSASMLDETAEGILRVANAEMAGAVRVMTVERGIDPRGARAARVRRRRADARRGGRGRARHAPRRRARAPRACCPRWGWWSRSAAVDVVDSVLLSGDGADRSEAIGAAVARLVERGAERARHRRRRGAGVVRRPLRGPGVRADGRRTEPDPGGAARGVRRARTQERYGYADPDAEIELVTVRVTVALPGGERERPGAAARRRASSTRPATVPLDEATLVVPEGWSRRRATRPGPGCWSGRPDGPGDAAGDARRAALDVRRDGRRARALGALGEHQGAARLVHRAVRRARPDGDAGRAHPGAPGRDAELGRRGARRGPPPGRRVDPERPLPRRHAPAGHHADLARVRRHET